MEQPTNNKNHRLSRELSALPTAELSSFWLKTAISMQKELINKATKIQQLLEQIWNEW